MSVGRMPAKDGDESGVKVDTKATQVAYEGTEVLKGKPGQFLAVLLVCSATMWALERPEPEAQPVLVADETESDTLAPQVSKVLARANVEPQSGGAGPIAASSGASAPGLKRLMSAVGTIAEASEPDSEPPEKSEPGKDGREPAINAPNDELQGFYRSLRRTKNKETNAVTRVVHFGDSTIVADLITGTARRKLQETYGDAGHGFMLVGKPWDWYQHQDIKARSSSSWKLNRVTNSTVKDHHYGLGGVTSRAWGPGAWSEYETSEAGTGKQFSKFSVFYRAQPKGGKVSIQADDETFELDTNTDVASDKVHTLDLDDAPHKVRVKAAGGGEVRLYGVAMERETPGIVYDSIGISGLRAKVLNRSDEAHFKAQLAARNPNLVIVQLGTNESEFTGLNMEHYKSDYAQLIRRIRSAVPNASCLVASPPDRAQRNERGRLATAPMIPKLVEVQAEVAAEEGCAFFNTFEAMGGRNSMVAWYRHKPRLGSGDYTHFTRAGGEALGILLYDALVEGVEGLK